MSKQDTLQIVVGLIRETLDLADDETISSEKLLFNDLNFISMDMLDLLFRIETQFDVVIQEKTFYELIRGELTDDEFAVEGILTTAGMKQLKTILYDTPAEIFPAGIHVNTIPIYCTVGAVVRLIDHKRKELDLS